MGTAPIAAGFLYVPISPDRATGDRRPVALVATADGHEVARSTIHDVAQVVGAGYAVSPEAGDTATVIKLMRVAMLAPVIVAVGLLAHRKRADQGERPPILPLFVVAFLLLVIANSLLPVPAAVQVPR